MPPNAQVHSWPFFSLNRILPRFRAEHVWPYLIFGLFNCRPQQHRTELFTFLSSVSLQLVVTLFWILPPANCHFLPPDPILIIHKTLILLTQILFSFSAGLFSCSDIRAKLLIAPAHVAFGLRDIHSFPFSRLAFSILLLLEAVHISTRAQRC